MFHSLENFLCVKISHQNKNGIVGTVKMTIVLDHLVLSDGGQILISADHWKPVRVFLERMGSHRFTESFPGAVPFHLDFLNDDLSFQFKFFGVKAIIAHPVCFDLQGGPPSIRSKSEVVGSIIT